MGRQWDAIRSTLAAFGDNRRIGVGGLESSEPKKPTGSNARKVAGSTCAVWGQKSVLFAGACGGLRSGTGSRDECSFDPSPGNRGGGHG